MTLQKLLINAYLQNLRFLHTFFLLFFYFNTPTSVTVYVTSTNPFGSYLMHLSWFPWSSSSYSQRSFRNYNLLWSFLRIVLDNPVYTFYSTSHFKRYKLFLDTVFMNRYWLTQATFTLVFLFVFSTTTSWPSSVTLPRLIKVGIPVAYRRALSCNLACTANRDYQLDLQHHRIKMALISCD